MSNLANKIQQVQHEQQQTIISPKRKKSQKSWLSPGEKILGMLFCVLVFVGAIHIISNQSAIYEVNKDIKNMSSSIQEQKKTNEDLTTQVSDLSNYDRVRKIAEKLGLTLDENNVKVVQR
ncbi:cell division protein FtsL [Bacillus sp. 03113]|uniref:cell division protein FtsL n=1 Tax=Bacillus sp. 03113 TaxID=2578211 RepID=UPI0011439FDA|nr:cell division protein FtsL [Bacillus sp. 03113]